MSFPRSDLAVLLSRSLCAGALICVVTLTLIDRGATRAYATPWIFLFWFAHVAPLLAVAIRAFPSVTAFVLPSRPWCLLASIFVAAVSLSSLLSPFRGPSLLSALTPFSAVAAFFLIHDLAQADNRRRTEWIERTISFFSLAILLVGLGRWTLSGFSSGAFQTLNGFFNHRNPFPLGHWNYTAGLALMAIPWLGWSALRSSGAARIGWSFATVLGIALLFSSGSRGGFLGAAALAAATVVSARVSRRLLVLVTLLAVTLTLALGYAHPRFRAMIFPKHTASVETQFSNLQRSSMAVAGWRMGADRPLLGWGPGTTPLVYPNYRAGLDGGVENALQLHSTPVQLWADLGLLGIACALAFFALLSGETWGRLRSSVKSARDPFSRPNHLLPPNLLQTPAATLLIGYSVFALTDYQLDVPVFAFGIAGAAAMLARSAPVDVASRRHVWLGASALAALAVVGFLGHRDPTPELNVRALAAAEDAQRKEEAVTLFNKSLALNPAQEIAHFNLGWLLVVTDPVTAEKHFLAASRLVPDKGGVYFGLALSRMNQDRADLTTGIVRALALESLNDPAFLISPWWRQPRIAAYRTATITELYTLASSAALRLAARGDRRSREADYIAVLGQWLDGRSAPGEILRRAQTSDRVSYFASRPPLPEWKTSPVKAYRRERTGYPVLMRNLDLPIPVDLFDVQENSLASGELAALFPPKGWLPGPLLLDLLNENPNLTAGAEADSSLPKTDS